MLREFTLHSSCTKLMRHKTRRPAYKNTSKIQYDQGPYYGHSLLFRKYPQQQTTGDSRICTQNKTMCLPCSYFSASRLLTTAEEGIQN